MKDHIGQPLQVGDRVAVAVPRDEAMKVLRGTVTAIEPELAVAWDGDLVPHVKADTEGNYNVALIHTVPEDRDGETVVVHTPPAPKKARKAKTEEAVPDA